MRQRIVWDETEKKKLARAMAERLHSDVQLSFRAAFNEAQSAVIAKGRHREIASFDFNTPWLAGMVEDELRTLRNTAAQQMARAGLETASLEELMAALTNRLVDTVRTRIQDEIQGEVERKIEAIVSQKVEAIMDQFTSPTDTAVAIIDKPTVGVQPGQKVSQRRKPTIAIIGPLQSQMAHVKLAIEGLANLTFIDKDTNPKNNEGSFRRADSVVAMTKFISHVHEDSILSALGKDNKEKYHRFNGGISGLTQYVKNLAERHSEMVQ